MQEMQTAPTVYPPTQSIASNASTIEAALATLASAPLESDHEADQLTWARQLCARGFAPFPCNGKLPVVAWKPYQKRQPTDEELVGWFGNGHQHNIGIPTGAEAGVVVVDLDSPAAEAWAQANLPATPMRVRTPRGGLHLYYRYPGFRVRNQAKVRNGDEKLAIDIRADGGYVMVPGSLNGGRPYESDGEWPTSLDALPMFNPNWFAGAASPEQPKKEQYEEPAATTDRSAIDRARAYLAKVPPAIEGQGGDNHTFIAACRVFRGFGLSDDQAFEVMQEWNARNQPPWSEADLKQKIANAREYGKEEMRGRVNADEQSEAREASPNHQTFQFLSVSDLLALPRLEWLIKHIFHRGVLVAVYGASGSGKTFFLLYAAMCVVANRTFFQRRVRPGPVVYVAAEGTGGIRQRVQAIVREFPDLNLEDFHLLLRPVNLLKDSEVSAFVDSVKPLAPSLVFVDTLNACMVGGDENTPKDMGQAIAGLKKIQESLACTVAVSHHTPKSNPEKERGHSSLRAAMDTMLSVVKDSSGLITIKADKQKDMAEGFLFAFRLKPVELGVDEDGDVLTSCVLDEAHGCKAPSQEPKMTTADRLLAILRTSPARAFSPAELKQQTALGKSTIYKHMESLIKAGRIQTSEAGGWQAVPTPFPHSTAV